MDNIMDISMDYMGYIMVITWFSSQPWPFFLHPSPSSLAVVLPRHRRLSARRAAGRRPGSPGPRRWSASPWSDLGEGRFEGKNRVNLGVNIWYVLALYLSISISTYIYIMYIILNYIILYYIMLYYVISYYIILCIIFLSYYIILYYITLYQIIFCYIELKYII